MRTHTRTHARTHTLTDGRAPQMCPHFVGEVAATDARAIAGGSPTGSGSYMVNIAEYSPIDGALFATAAYYAARCLQRLEESKWLARCGPEDGAGYTLGIRAIIQDDYSVKESGAAGPSAAADGDAPFEAD